MRFSTLISFLLGQLILSDSPVIAQEYSVYRPASGFFVCPSVGMVCKVLGCGNGDCSIISNGFQENAISQGGIVLTSVMPGADLSVLVDEGSNAVTQCDIGCACQSILDAVECSLVGGFPGDTRTNAQGSASAASSQGSNGATVTQVQVSRTEGVDAFDVAAASGESNGSERTASSGSTMTWAASFLFTTIGLFVMQL